MNAMPAISQANQQDQQGLASYHPTTSCLPLALRTLLNTEGETGWYPPVVNDQQRSMVSAAMPIYSKLMVPAHGDDINARITVLLGHFFVVATSPEIMQMMLKDWEKALSGLPMWAINTACTQWLATETDKPKPADIRRLADGLFAEVRDDYAKLTAILEQKESSDRKSNLPALLRSRVDAVKIKLWVAPCAVSVTGDTVTIRTPSPYHRDGIERCLGTEIAAVYRGKRVVYLTAAQ